MAIPISIGKLLTENVVEWARIEFKEGWNPKTLQYLMGHSKIGVTLNANALFISFRDDIRRNKN